MYKFQIFQLLPWNPRRKTGRAAPIQSNVGPAANGSIPTTPNMPNLRKRTAADSPTILGICKRCSTIKKSPMGRRMVRRGSRHNNGGPAQKKKQERGKIWTGTALLVSQRHLQSAFRLLRSGMLGSGDSHELLVQGNDAQTEIVGRFTKQHAFARENLQNGSSANQNVSSANIWRVSGARKTTPAPRT